MRAVPTRAAARCRLRPAVVALALTTLLSGLLGVRAPSAYAVDDYPTRLRAAAPDTVVDPWGFWNRECVSFVAWRLNQAHVTRAGVPFTAYWGTAANGLDHWGDASEWDAYARGLGYRVDTIPAVGAIAQWHAGELAGRIVASSYGHVAYVSAVAPDGSVTIEDYNGTGGADAYGTLSGVRAPRYIHLGDAATATPQPVAPPAVAPQPVAPSPASTVTARTTSAASKSTTRSATRPAPSALSSATSSATSSASSASPSDALAVSAPAVHPTTTAPRAPTVALEWIRAVDAHVGPDAVAGRSSARASGLARWWPITILLPALLVALVASLVASRSRRRAAHALLLQGVRRG